jgi:hypothetical protein
MPLWTKTDEAAGAPKWTIAPGANVATLGNSVFANTTPSAFINNATVGIFGANTSEAVAFPGNGTPGWIKTTVGTGPVLAISNVSGGAGFVNGATITISNGSSNGVAVITTNATSNIVSVEVTSGGSGFVNTSMVAATFTREKYANAIVYTGTATGYTNGDIVTISNAIINATATVSTNATGGTLTFAFTNKGVFSNTISNTQVVISIANSSGGTSSGSGATFTSANLFASTGGTINLDSISLGGRAGRINREPLVVFKGMTGTGSSSP